MPTSLRLSVRSRLLALMLVFAILPVTGEVVELVVHWAQHGDVSHAADDAHGSDPLGTDEHGCSGLFHLCACHSAQATTPQTNSVVPHVTCDRSVATIAFLSRDGLGAPAPSIRPPIA